MSRRHDSQDRISRDTATGSRSAHSRDESKYQSTDRHEASRDGQKFRERPRSRAREQLRNSRRSTEREQYEQSNRSRIRPVSRESEQFRNNQQSSNRPRSREREKFRYSQRSSDREPVRNRQQSTERPRSREIEQTQRSQSHNRQTSRDRKWFHSKRAHEDYRGAKTEYPTSSTSHENTLVRSQPAKSTKSTEQRSLTESTAEPPPPKANPFKSKPTSTSTKTCDYSTSKACPEQNTSNANNPFGPSQSNPEAERDTNSPDPTLDFRSPLFDPLKALYSSNITIPMPRAKTYDNVSIFEAKLLGKNLLPKTRVPLITEPAVPIERRFAPEQMMVDKPAPSKRHVRNVLTKVNDFVGPTGHLNTYIKSGQYIKVYTRKLNGIAGYVVGRLLCFDRYWNLLMADVTEVYERRKLAYSWTASNGPVDDCTQRLLELKIKLPAVTVKSLDRKNVLCIRKVGSLLVAGEQVVSVATVLPIVHKVPKVSRKDRKVLEKVKNT